MQAKRIVLLVVSFIISLSSFAQGEDFKLFQSGENGKWGYYNDKGEIVIEPKFDWAESFSNGVAKVIYNHYGIAIDEEGRDLCWSYSPYCDYYEGYVIKREEWGKRYDWFTIYYYDKTKGIESPVKNKILSTKKNYGVDYQNSIYDCVYHLGGGLLAVRVDDPKEKKPSKWGLMRVDGKTVCKAIYDGIGDCYSTYRYRPNNEDRRIHPYLELKGFSDGLCPVCVCKKKSNDIYGDICKYGYIDTTGKIAIDIKYDNVTHFSEGLAAVEENNKWGYINTKGEWVIEPQYLEAGIFSEGLASVRKDGRRCYIDRNGHTVISIDLDSEEYLKYCENDQRNVLIKLGVLGVFENGLAPLYSWWKGYWYWVCKIDKKGRGYEIGSFYMPELGLLSVKSDGLWGVIDKEGNDIVVPFSTERPQYDAATGLVKFADQYYNRKGELVANPLNNTIATIVWPYVPSFTDQPKFVLNATINSGSKIEYCKVFWNNIELREDSAPCGSSIVEEQKGGNNISISRTLFLFEGTNTIKIEAKNAGGITTDERKIVYTPKKQEPVAVAKALIEWGDLPTITTNPRLELDAMVRSTVSDVSCRVSLNGVEVPKTKGSSIVEDSKELEYKYKLEIQRTLNLRENDNKIVIEVRDAKGKLLASGEKNVIYTKPAMATIVWGDVPFTTEEKQLTLKAQIKSDSPIEYYSILKDEKVLKKVIINVAAKGSSIAEDPKKGSDYNVQVNDIVELAEGDNSFVIEVKNAGGVVRTQTKTVRHKYKEKRIALVIGNEAYDDERMRLTCPSNDANAVAARYGQLGFDEVILRENLPKKEMQALINEFRSKSMNYDAVVVYYSGHGVQVNQINYMIPTDFDFSNGSVTNDCVAVTYLLRDLGEDRMKIVVYDACRTQPKPKGDITDIDVLNNVNTFIAYASSVGQPSYEDSDSSYSIYTAAFLKVLDEPNLKLGDVFSKVNRIVRQKTSNMNVKQVPYIEGSVDKDFIFNKKESR